MSPTRMKRTVNSRIVANSSEVRSGRHQAFKPSVYRYVHAAWRPNTEGSIMLNSIKSLANTPRAAAAPVSIAGIEQRSKVQWRDVALFTGLAYAFAWVLWIALRPNLFHLLSASHTPSKLLVPPIYEFGMFAPAAAAIVMRLFVSKEGLKDSLGPVRAWRFYALALLLAAVVVSLVIGVDALTGLGTFTWKRKPALWIAYAGLAFDGLTYSALLALGEEYGWRGYLLPKLLPLGEIKAAVVVGAIWGTWHLPMLIAGLNYPGVGPLAAIGIFIPVAIAMSVLFARVFLISGGAVLVAAVLHGSFNAFGDKLTNANHLTGSPLVVTPAGAVGIGVILITAAMVYALSKTGRLQRRRVTARVAASGHGVA
jgi:CAAX protease family protein